MAHPSSADEDTHQAGLDAYLELGGNCIHLHGEGDETHSRRATGKWLRENGLRREFFVCTQICHSGWDAAANHAIDRFTPAAVREDIDADLESLATDYLDLVYLDDNPEAQPESVIDEIGREIGRGRVRAFGVRNWKPERIVAARAHLLRESLPSIAAVFTTELALATPTAPLWPEYVPFDAELGRVVSSLDLAVFAHAGDMNIGQCFFRDNVSGSLRRWDSPANIALSSRVRRFAAGRGLTPREVNIAWILNQPFPSVRVVPLPSLAGSVSGEYEGASRIVLAAT